jgi:hypothetical protein
MKSLDAAMYSTYHPFFDANSNSRGTLVASRDEVVCSFSFGRQPEKPLASAPFINQNRDRNSQAGRVDRRDPSPSRADHGFGSCGWNGEVDPSPDFFSEQERSLFYGITTARPP